MNTKINLEYLQNEYDRLRAQKGEGAYMHISELFNQVREKYKRQYLTSPKAKKTRQQGKTPDAEQSWKAFKGKNFELLILYLLQKEIEQIGLKAIKGNTLAKENLDNSLNRVYRNLLIRYGQYSILPDADLVVFNPRNSNVIAIISVKITLRERIAQTAYWKLKLAQDPITMHVRGLFVTTDEDGDLKYSLSPEKKSRNRIIVEYDLDGTYVLNDIAESDKVKPFPKLVEDLKKIQNVRG